MNTSFVAQDNYPSVYRMPMTKHHELQSLYEDILAGATVDQVHTKLVDYVTEVVEPIGWSAVWRATEKSSGLDFQCDFEVDVIDVSHNALDAVVIVRQVLSVADLSIAQQTQVTGLMKVGKVMNVPLIELYVVSEKDENEDFKRTAVVIEHARFFYRHLWRAWDGYTGTNAPTNELFVDSRLQPRLNLYFDIQNKLLPEATVNKIKKLLAESWQVRQQLDELAAAMDKVADVDPASDDKYLDEADVYEGMRLRVRLEDIEREIKMLEDPYMRVVANSMASAAGGDDVTDKPQVPVCHVLAREYTVKELQVIVNKLEVRTASKREAM